MNNDINAVDSRLKIRSPIIIDRQVDYNPQEMSLQTWIWVIITIVWRISKSL
jgi:hypothetical protein